MVMVDVLARGEPVLEVMLRGGGSSHGEASAWAAIVSSMLASPQGASEQYMCSVTASFRANG